MQSTRRANIEQYRMIAKANSQLINGHDTDSGEGAVLVKDHLPEATTKPLHFGRSLTGGSTVLYLQ